MTTDTAAPVDTTPARLRLEPVSLDRAPDVRRFVEDLGLGLLDDEALTSFAGRNDNWAGTTDRGVAVFVKRIGGESGDVAGRMRRLNAFESVAEHLTGPLRSPACLGTDTDTRLVAFELLPDARSGAELAGDLEFDEAVCEVAGESVGALHAAAVPGGTVLDATPHPLPPLAELTALPLGFLIGASGAQVEVWGLLQGDAGLVEPIRGVREAEGLVVPRPVHGDLRLDQFLLAGGRLHLTDWEEFRLGDPARDVGAFAGEWLYRAVGQIPAAIGVATGYAYAHEVTHEEIVAHGTGEVDRVRPHVEAFCRGYLRSAPVDVPGAAPDLAVRAAAFAGWHLIDRMIAAAAQRNRLSALDRAAAGIGRTALVDPAAFVTVLGLQELLP